MRIRIVVFCRLWAVLDSNQWPPACKASTCRIRSPHAATKRLHTPTIRDARGWRRSIRVLAGSFQRSGTGQASPGIEHAYCESVHASSVSPWHIRRLGPKGICPGGGADTPALCGREVSWDIPNVPVGAPLANNCCRACAGRLDGVFV